MYITLYPDKTQMFWFNKPKAKCLQKGTSILFCSDEMPTVGLCEWARNNFKIPFHYRDCSITKSKD